MKYYKESVKANNLWAVKKIANIWVLNYAYAVAWKTSGKDTRKQF